MLFIPDHHLIYDYINKNDFSYVTIYVIVVYPKPRCEVENVQIFT
jgi:hypothetical protein